MEQQKVQCECGKTLAYQDDKAVYIKCGGKRDGHKCGCIKTIPKK